MHYELHCQSVYMIFFGKLETTSLETIY